MDGLKKMRFCPFCRNHCPIDNPKCPEIYNLGIMAQKAADYNLSDGICVICEKRCPYTDLKCDTGITIARIKEILPRESEN